MTLGGLGAGVVGFDGTVNIYRSTINVPSLGSYGGGGDRLVLYQGGASAYPYALGINASTLWYSVPSGTTHKWYIGGTNNMTLDSANNLTVAGAINCSGAAFTTANESTFKYIRIVNPDGRNTHFHILETVRII